jgi:hypothetical protein
MDVSAKVSSKGQVTIPRAVLTLKHPYKHPYGIAPCDPPRLKRAQSTQTGPPDTGISRIRYAVPIPPSLARSEFGSGLSFASVGVGEP